MSDQLNKAYQATPNATLRDQIMNPNFPKNEREWWAADRIEQLEAALREIIIHCDWPDRVEKYARDALEERT